jgi:hypothetical protein
MYPEFWPDSKSAHEYPLEDETVPEDCPFCRLLREPDTHIFKDSELFRVVRCLTLKGHRERIMVVYKYHKKRLPAGYQVMAMMELGFVAPAAFHYTKKWVVMAPTFSTYRDHWHLVVTDLDPTADDFDQILETEWYRVTNQ